MPSIIESPPQESNALSFEAEKECLFVNLKTLPPTELSYYFAELVAIIDNEKNTEQHRHLITKANTIVNALKKFYEDDKAHSANNLTAVTEQVNDLIQCTKFRTISHKIKKGILSVCSAVLGFIIGVVGSVVGFFGGLFSDYNPKKSFIAAGYGFLTGLVIGSFAGSRCLNMVFQSSFERKLESCIHHIEKVSKELTLKKDRAVYEQETKKYIIDTFFKDKSDIKDESGKTEKERAFEAFIESDAQKIQVCTTTAQFLAKSLKGHVGHHTLIRYDINGAAPNDGQKRYYSPMEYGAVGYSPNFVDQNESLRTITGQKLFDMLVLERMLLETYKYTAKNLLKDYDIGTNDCKTYVNKLLIGTGQAPTQIARFNPEIDKWSGTHIVGPIVRFFSKTSDNEIKPIVKYFKENPDAPDPTIESRRWTGEKSVSPAPADDAAAAVSRVAP